MVEQQLGGAVIRQKPCGGNGEGGTGGEQRRVALQRGLRRAGGGRRQPRMGTAQQQHGSREATG